jgi:hypothetical protein
VDLLSAAERLSTYTIQSPANHTKARMGHIMAKDGKGFTTFSGSPDTFQRDPVGTFTYSSFPSGWSDTAQVSPDSTAPKPSAVVIAAQP